MFTYRKIFGAAASAVAVAGMIAASTLPAAAGHRNHGSDAAVAGLIGLGAGLIIGGAIANNPPAPAATYYRYERPRYRTYYRDYPVRYRYERPVRYDRYGSEAPPAWSADWFAYCTSKYRSFNRRTGYFVGYDGEYHFCR